MEQNIAFNGERVIEGNTPNRIWNDHVERYNFAAKFVKNNYVLDIACGTGYGSAILARNGAKKVVGIDISEEAIEYAKNRYKDKNIIFEKGNIVTFNSKKIYDIIVCFETIEHVKAYSLAITNLYKALADKGKLIISTPNRIITSPMNKSMFDKPENRYHYYEFSKEEIIEILEDSNFSVNQIYGQRERTYLKNRYLRAIQNRIFNHDERSNSFVKPVLIKVPRYFIMITTKNTVVKMRYDRA